MQPEGFNQEEAAKHLLAMEKASREAKEQKRLEVLANCQSYLKKRFSPEGIEVYLVGSITRPYEFRSDSDIDIVLKGYIGDRFEIWTELEEALNRRIEVILFESCHFKDHVIQHGIKVV